MNVISLFNGMGTLRQAFADMNIKVDKYYSSEIKPYAIELQQHHCEGSWPTSVNVLSVYTSHTPVLPYVSLTRA